MQEKLIQCDWLQYSVILADAEPELFCPTNCRIELLSGNNIFQFRAIVYRDGSRWLTLLWHPYSSLLNDKLMTVQVDNHVLYLDAINEADRMLHEIVDCRFNAIGRYDVACDFVITDRQLRILKHINSNHYYMQRKSKGSAWWHMQSGIVEEKLLHCLAFGSPTSEIKLKIYNKSYEQSMTSSSPSPDKPYIVDRWRLMNWDVTRVWRIEFSLQSTSQLKWNNEVIDLAKVTSQQFCEDIFAKLYSTRMVIRQNSGRKTFHYVGGVRKLKSNNDAVIPFFEDAITSTSQLKWNDYAPANLSESIMLAGKFLGMLEHPYVQCSQSLYSEIRSCLVNLISVDEKVRIYLQYRFGRSVEDILRMYDAQAGLGILQVDSKPSKVIN